MIRIRSSSLFCLVAVLFALPAAANAADRWSLLIGSEKGIHGIDDNGKAAPLWTDGEVRKIMRVGDRWLALSSRGIIATTDLKIWEARNVGLPVKVLKSYNDGRKSFDRVIQELKDLEADPTNPQTLVTATKDSVFLSRDGGATWKNLGTPSRTNGLKAVAVASLPGLTVFATHGIYGVQYLEVEKSGARWTELNGGLEKLETTGNPDEVSDIAVTLPVSAGTQSEIYAAQTFKGRIYRLDWTAKTFVPIWTDGAEFGTVESIDPAPGILRFVRQGEIDELRLNGTAQGAAANPGTLTNRQDLTALVSRVATAVGASPECIRGEGERSAWVGLAGNGGLELSELWLLGKGTDSGSTRRAAASGREGLYLPANHAADQKLLKPYLSIIDERGLDMVVVDMKDDYGRLRFTPRSQAVAAKGRVFNPIDVEAFVSTMKARGVWLVARVVVFKDPELAKKDGGKYAVWDAKENAPWVGYTETRQKKVPAAPAAAGSTPAGSAAPAASPMVGAPLTSPASGVTTNGAKTPATAAAGASTVPATGAAAPAAADEYETVRTPRDEHWVDPYAEEVWDYVASLSSELVSRGFDEIQFDYIRFPTDGDNLADARYRWKDAGMDMESAILSFLNHVRSRIAAPLSVDIYGANGWYRTGARTGQEVELISHYVDVICPMYYPSHFEQEFLAHSPAELRPYRIYYRGTLRTQLIARGKVTVRPYAQSFYMNVSYDKKYYGSDYVRRELEGVRDAGENGLTYWNNVGRYDEIPLPDARTAAKKTEKEKAALD